MPTNDYFAKTLSLGESLMLRHNLRGTHPLFEPSTAHPVKLDSTPEFSALLERFAIVPRKYSLGYASLFALYESLVGTRPKCVLEFGSGISTELLLACHLELGFPQQIISVEQDRDYAEKLLAGLKETFSKTVVNRALKLVVAPCKNQQIQGIEFTFYDVKALMAGVDGCSIDLFIVDGPSGGWSHRFFGAIAARRMAAPNALLILHDALRDWELRVAEIWWQMGLVHPGTIYWADRGIFKARIIDHPGLKDWLLPAEIRLMQDAFGGKAKGLFEGAGFWQAPPIRQPNTKENLQEQAELLTCRITSTEHIPLVKVLHKIEGAAFDLVQPRNAKTLTDAQQQRLFVRDTQNLFIDARVVSLPNPLILPKGPILQGGDSIIAENLEGSLKDQGIELRQGAADCRVEKATLIPGPRGRALIIEKHGVKNYALWFMEILTRLYFAAKVAKVDFDYILLTQTPNLTQAQQDLRHESIRWIVDNEIPIVQQTIKPREALLLEQGILPIVNTGSRNTRLTEYFLPMVAHIKSNMALPTATPGRRIFVDRQDSHVRKIENHSEVIALVRSLGYEVINPGSLNLREQINTFASATDICGVHGAGLLNIAWAPDSARIVEIFPEPALNRNTFRHIAGLRGLDYWVVCVAAEYCKVTPQGDDVFSLTIDVKQLHRLLLETMV